MFQIANLLTLLTKILVISQNRPIDDMLWFLDRTIVGIKSHDNWVRDIVWNVGSIHDIL